jgi:hypothetical protein
LSNVFPFFFAGCSILFSFFHLVAFYHLWRTGRLDLKSWKFTAPQWSIFVRCSFECKIFDRLKRLMRQNSDASKFLLTPSSLCPSSNHHLKL